ncbi:MAG: HupE/UreJ family protein [Verrucomicrobia bacterium]|nr:HupE/UreJ family protein [Verrucomicrobiota bacterium]
MKRHLPLLLLIGLFGSAVAATAHPSQFHSQDMAGVARAGFLHPLTGIDHFLVMVAVGLWAVQIGGRALWLLPSSFVGSMMIGGAMGLDLCGVHQPFVEHGILASIVLLGAALGMAWRPSLLISSLCVGAAGLCHGYIHGSEMPSGVLPVMFFAGMIIVTSLLHASGVGAGLLLRDQKFAMLMRTAGLCLLAFAVYDFYF